MQRSEGDNAGYSLSRRKFLEGALLATGFGLTLGGCEIFKPEPPVSDSILFFQTYPIVNTYMWGIGAYDRRGIRRIQISDSRGSIFKTLSGDSVFQSPVGDNFVYRKIDYVDDNYSRPVPTNERFVIANTKNDDETGIPLPTEGYPNGANLTNIAWHPDGSTIYFSNMDSKKMPGIWGYNVRDSRSFQVLSSAPLSIDSVKSISPDGEKLLFSHNLGEALTIAPLDPKRYPYSGESHESTNPNFISLHDASGKVYSLGWAQDSQKLFYSTSTMGKQSDFPFVLHIGDLLNIGIRDVVIENSKEPDLASLSHDRNRVAFWERNRGLVIFDMASGRIVRGVDKNARFKSALTDLSWTTDDQEILISSSEICYRVNQDGTNLRRLIDLPQY